MTRSALALCLPALAHSGCSPGAITCYNGHSTGAQNIIAGSDQVYGADSLTQEYCAQLCADRSATLAGVDSGNGCYCGDAITAGAEVRPLAECNMVCTGSRTEMCGGDWRQGVFGVNCSGAPVPPPAELPKMVNPCRGGAASNPLAAAPFCDASLPLPARVADAVGRMTLAEKVTCLGSQSGAVPSLGLVHYDWWNEATHGVASGGTGVRNDASTPYETNFAFPITTAMSFNRSLWGATGAAIAREARAFANAGNAYATFWAPVINLAREPRWGRNIECPGEDPLLTGAYAATFVLGFERSELDGGATLQASACCKHYVANSMESSTDGDGVHHDRNHFDAAVTQQDLLDSYMPAFQACVEKGRVSGLMCSYNAVNGVPSCANSWLLDTVARKEWGFDGYVASDCDADADVFVSHNYTSTAAEAVAAVLKAGTDLDCGTFVSLNVRDALDQGLVTMADVDARLTQLFRVRFRLGHFDPPGPLDSLTNASICAAGALATSYEGVTQGATLLKNVGGTLPIRGAGGTIAVIGPAVNQTDPSKPHNVVGYYGGNQPCKGRFYNVVDAVTHGAAAAAEGAGAAAAADNAGTGGGGWRVVSAEGVPNVGSNDTAGVAGAARMAAAADEVVLAVGTDLTLAREGHDATSIEFSAGQAALIEAVAAAAKKPVTLLLLTATPLDLTAQLANPKVGAILHLGQPSVAVLGVGELLFGQRAPAGRAIQTVYPASYADEVSIFDFNMRPGPSLFPRPDCTKPAAKCPNGTNPGRTHRFYTGKAVVPFGFGLSYTTFAYALSKAMPPAVVSAAPVAAMLAATVAAGRTFPARALLDAAAPLVQYEVTVTNTGSVDSDDAVLGFLVPPGAGQNGVPLQSLFGFERVHVPAGQSVTVYLYPELTEFTQVGLDGTRSTLLGAYTVRFGEPRSAALGQGIVEHSFVLAD